MAQALTVLQMRNRFQKLVDAGYGSLPVLSAGKRAAESPIVVGKEARFIGPSEWDENTFTLGNEGSGHSVII